MSDLAPHVPNTKTIFRVFAYILVVFLFGAFFNTSCSMMNEANDASFTVGAGLTFLGFLAGVLFVRHVVLFVSSKFNQGS